MEQLKAAAAAEKDFGICYFYCSFDNLGTQGPSNVFGSLALQLSEKVPSILDDISDLYASEQDKVTLRSLTAEDLVKLLIKGIGGLSKTYFVIDAINESEKGDEILEIATQLAAQCQHLRLVLSCTRGYDRIAHGDEFRVLDVDMIAEKVDEDILSLVDAALRRHPVLRTFSEQLKDDIRQTLHSQSDGM